ncbi:peptidoglycan-binding domain-containing protein [Streptomyces scabiei]|nr:peptidoglycan-binding domain-containing protein [Streptomyces scabiei]
MQRLLNDHLPDLQLAVDGRFGPVTDGRVRQFQQRFAIVPDGIVGPQTWGHLTPSRKSSRADFRRQLRASPAA